MEPEFLVLSRGGDSPEKDPVTVRSEDQHSPKRVLGSGLMVMEGDLDENKLGVSEIVDEIYEGVSSIVEYSLQWKENNEDLKKRALEVEVKEKSLMERTVELEKKEERSREVEERERKIGLLEKSVTLRLKEMEKDVEAKLYMESCLMRLVLEKREEEVMEREKEAECLSKLVDAKACELDKRVKEFDLKEQESTEKRRKEAVLVGVSLRQLEEKEKELRLLEEAIKERRTEVEKKVEVIEAKEKKFRSFDQTLNEKWTELEMKVKVIESKEKRLNEALKEKWAEVEKNEESLEAKEKELRLFAESLKEKWTEVEKKEEIFEAKEKATADEMEQKEKFLELRERKLEEMVKEFELKQRGLQKSSTGAETSQRSRVKLLAEKGSEADYLVRPIKRHKSRSEHSHIDDVDEEEKETDSAYGVSASTFSSVQMSEEHDGGIEEVFRIDDSDDDDEDPEPILCVDSEFNDFEKSMSSFVVGQVWALYDPVDTMPRLYAQIKRITKSRSSFQVTWLESRDEESVPVACGRFKTGNTETIISHLTFSHEVHTIRHGRKFIAVNPRKGEMWALFRDWNESWNNNPKLPKTPYRYDFVEVVHNFDDSLGVGVAYLGKVDGFVSIFKHAMKDKVFSFMITPEEMQKFSHQVPSFRMNGGEKEGVPPGSFELDPAAIPDSEIKFEHSTREEAEETERQYDDCGTAGEVKEEGSDHSTREEAQETERQGEDCGIAGEVTEHDGSSKNIPIILD